MSLLLLFNYSGEEDSALPITPVLQPAGATIGSGTVGSGTIGGLDVEEHLDAIREAFAPRRDLTGSEEALLAIIATCLHGILTMDYGITATGAAPFVVIVYLALRSALRCLERPFL